MADIKKGKEKLPRKAEQPAVTQKLGEEAVERKELVHQEVESPDRKETQRIRQEIEETALGERLNVQTQVSAQQLAPLEEKEKIEHLMELAKAKGVEFAVKVAQRMQDPYLLDTLHDLLAANGYYRKFTR